MFNFTKHSLTAAAAAAIAMAATAAGAQAAPTTLASESASTHVAAYDGTVMWSTLDRSTGRYQLMKSVGGAPGVSVGVPQRDGPFDVDLGTNSTGSQYAVYTREGFIYRLRVSTSAEQKLTALSIGGQNGYPSIQRGRIAFLHSGRGVSELRLGSTASGAGKPKVLVKGTIDSVELGVKQVAYVTSSRGSYGFGQKNVHIRNTSTGHDQSVYRAQSGGANAARVTKPSFTEDARAFIWARTNNGSGTGNRLVKYTLRSSRLSYAQGKPSYATTAWAGDELGAAFSTSLDASSNAGCEDAGKNYCSVGLTGPLSFDAGA